MRKHYVYFYGSTKVICGYNSLSRESLKRRLQLICFEGIDKNLQFAELCEKCLFAKNSDGIPCGETVTLFPKENITIVPFRYEWCIDNKEDIILKHLEDVIEVNERFVKAESINFPLMELKEATMEGRNLLGKGGGFDSMPLFNFDKDGKPDGFIKGSSRKDREKLFADKWCCFGHYYLVLIKKALDNKGYFAMGRPGGDLSNLRDEMFKKTDGTRLMVHADAGM